MPIQDPDFRMEEEPGATVEKEQQGAVSEILQRRGQEFQEIAKRELGGPTVVAPGLLRASGPDQDILSFLLQTVGKTGLGTASDLIGAAGSAMIPEPVKEAVTSGLGALANTEVGGSLLQALQGGVESYQKWAKDNPTLAANLEATTNIATAIPSTGVSAISKNPFIRAVENSATQKRIDRAKEIIRPDRELSKAIAEERLKDTKQTGLLGNLSIELNKQEERAAELFGEVYDSNKPFVVNYNAGAEAIRQKSDDLIPKIDAATSTNANRIQPRRFLRDLTVELGKLYDEKPTLKSERSVERNIRKKYISILKKYTNTNTKTFMNPSDLLRVRREFDNWWQTELKRVDFKGNPNHAELVVGLYRRVTNDAIDAAVPDAQVKQELSDISSMIRANENVKIKAISESSKAIQRTFDRLGLSQPSTIASNAATLGVVTGGIAAITKALTSLSGVEAVAAGGAITGLAVAVPTAIKIFRSPQTKRNFVKLVEALDRKKSFAASASLIESVNGLYTSIGEEPLFPEQKQEEQK